MMTNVFHDPDCDELGFEDIEEQFESGVFSESAGIGYTIEDLNRDGVYESASTEDPKVSTRLYRVEEVPDTTSQPVIPDTPPPQPSTPPQPATPVDTSPPPATPVDTPAPTPTETPTPETPTEMPSSEEAET